MQYNPLGHSTLSVSKIGFGCMSLAENDTSATSLLHAAIDKGINFFDTADLYAQGRNETMLGKALKEKRKDILIATKAGNQLKPDGSGWLWNPRKDYILSAVNNSLQRLQTDYIDLYQLHGGTMADNIDETIEAFTILQQQGKIRFYGISSIRPNVIRSYAYRSTLSSVMMQYSLLDRRPEESCFELLADKNIGVLARGGLAGGLLVDKPSKAYLNYSEDAVKKAATAINMLTDKNRGATQIALQFVLQQPAVSSAVVGIRTMDQLNEAVKTMDTPPLSLEAIIQLKKAVTANYYKEHR
jgi:aryl-alcohol dehydrogenase-like predicted oxidoreductase